MAALTPIFVNGWKSTVQSGSSAIGSASATGINVATGDGAKLGTITNQYVPMVVTDTSGTITEYVWGTAVATDTLTVTRQAEDSTRFPASTTSIQSGYSIYAVASVSAFRWLGFSGASPGPTAYKTGYWLSSNVTGALTASVTCPNTAIFQATPVWLPQQLTFDRIGLQNQTTNASGQTRLGLYGSAANGMPGDLILDAGLVSTTTTGDKWVTISQTLPAGLYWIGMTSSHALNYLGGTAAQLAPILGSSSAGLDTAPMTAAYYSQTYTAALTTSPTWSLSSGGWPLTFLRLA